MNATALLHCFLAAAQTAPPDPSQFFSQTLQLITIVIGIGVAIVSVMSFLGHRNINAQRDKLEQEMRNLRADLRSDTQRLQDQVEARIQRIDGLLDKFQDESKEKLKVLEEKGGSIQQTIASGQDLVTKVQEQAERVEKLIAEVDSKIRAQTESIISKLSSGGGLDRQEKQILATRESEIEAKDVDRRTPNDWLALGAARFSGDDFRGAVKYLQRAVAAGLSEDEEIEARDQLGSSFRYEGKYREALEEFRKAHELARKKRRVSSMVSALNGMSKMQALLGNLDEALRLNTQALAYLELPNAFHSPWVVYYNRALILSLKGLKENSPEYEKMLEKLESFTIKPVWKELMERDATEFDLASHPELGELFKFCSALPTTEEKIMSINRALRARG